MTITRALIQALTDAELAHQLRSEEYDVENFHLYITEVLARLLERGIPAVTISTDELKPYQLL